MIYVITTGAGREAEAADALRGAGYTVYAPRAIRRRRSGERIDFTAEILFPGYLFLDVKALTAADYYKIRNVKAVGRFLSQTSCLSESEAEYIRLLHNRGETIGIGKGRIENGRLKIESGWLKRFEDRIVRWSARQHKAVAEITLYGKSYRITCTVDIRHNDGIDLGEHLPVMVGMSKADTSIE
ncbi:MAG: hypothetical protein NC084_09730 [Bacteroides sp.]|nr:hypothetical protein [Roseburia sp.]MCM1462977.1 hypothetical protein [Bacteroides sp.]